MTAPAAPVPRLSWRKAIGGLIAFAVLGFALTALLAIGMMALVAGSARGGAAAVLMVQGIATLAGFGLATWVVGVKALALSGEALRTSPIAALPRGLALGFVVGALPAALALVLGVIVGDAAWVPDAGGPGAYLAQVGRTFVVLAPAAFSEELMFRGLPLVLLAAVLGRSTGAVVLSLLFGLAHIGNPGVTPLALGNIALAGILLSVAFYLPGGLWTAFGAHLGWNGTLAALDAPVSGLPFAIPMLDYHAGGPVWLTGGSFGPEGGLLATGAIALAIVVAARWAGEQRT